MKDIKSTKIIHVLLQINPALFLLENNSFNSGSGIMAKIDQQRQAHAGCLQIIEHLRILFLTHVFDGLDLNDYLVITNQIRLISLKQLCAFVI